MRLSVKKTEENESGKGISFDLGATLCFPKREGGVRCYEIKVGVHLLVERVEK